MENTYTVGEVRDIFQNLVDEGLENEKVFASPGRRFVNVDEVIKKDGKVFILLERDTVGYILDDKTLGPTDV